MTSHCVMQIFSISIYCGVMSRECYSCVDGNQSVDCSVRCLLKLVYFLTNIVVIIRWCFYRVAVLRHRVRYDDGICLAAATWLTLGRCRPVWFAFSVSTFCVVLHGNISSSSLWVFNLCTVYNTYHISYSLVVIISCMATRVDWLWFVVSRAEVDHRLSLCAFRFSGIPAQSINRLCLQFL